MDYARRVLFEPLDIETRPAYQGSLFDVDKSEMEKIKPSAGCAIMKAFIADLLA